MIKLLVIADDFTGALDTGVQFAGKGMTTKVLSYLPEDGEALQQFQAQVLVIDAQTRHLDGGEAYRKVLELVKSAKDAGIPYIYKKTDSGLRGNIGKELDAALTASGEQYLTFIPALPAMDRITVGEFTMWKEYRSMRALLGGILSNRLCRPMWKICSGMCR